MSLSYLYLCNKVLESVNEPEMDQSAFNNAIGFDARVKTAVNQGILDIYQEEEVQWPWANSETSFETVTGTREYTRPITIDVIDWETFVLDGKNISLSSLIQSSGVATATTTEDHLLKVDDQITIYGADQDGYNGTFSVGSVPSSTTFTFTVASTTSSPATGSIVTTRAYSTEYLDLIPYSVYKQHYQELDDNRNPNTYERPSRVVRGKNNAIIIDPTPDRAYKVTYDSYAYPEVLVNFDDVTEIPDQYEQIIVEAALVYVYKFRDNYEMTRETKNEVEDRVNAMRRIEIPKAPHMTIGN